ncbi:DUF6992 family protein [Longibacter salinarum]|nr:hypothetical protein [Longibacter salinarum]
MSQHSITRLLVVMAFLASSMPYSQAFAQQLESPATSVAAVPIPVAHDTANLYPHSNERVETLVEDRMAAERAHLWRVAAWGSVNALGGLALILGASRPERPAWWGFGAQSGLWGVVNIGIATAGLVSGDDPTRGYEAAVSAERFYHDILLFNLGLNVAYSSVGTTLVLLSYRGVDSARALRGHGSSLIMQGAGLFVLDLIAFLGSRTRLTGLLDMAGSLSGRALPTGFAFTLSL